MQGLQLVTVVLFTALQPLLCEKIEVKLPSACNELSDGYHYIQPISESRLNSLLGNENDDDQVSAMPVKVMCSNGMTIINPELDENIISYFSSYHKYHVSFAGPSLDDHVSWENWWLPAKEDASTDEIESDNLSENSRLLLSSDTTINSLTQWSVSEDCNSCFDEDAEEMEYGSYTTYYMTGDTYGCNWYTKFICDFDIETLECYQCSSKTSSTNELYYGKCGHMPLASYTTSHSKHKYCTEQNGEYLPSIGTVSKYCVCYKPSTWDYIDTTFDFSSNSNNNNLINSKDIITSFEEEIDEDVNRVVYLNSDDFTSGTYRITRPGTYILQEDIVFDFNGGDIDSPNEMYAWMPYAEQASEYEGAGEDEWDGPYWLGFFAGITIESSDVVLDLNGFEISMSHAFYLQQRVFTCIELNNKMFRDGEGPTWMGAGLTEVSNVMIKNGVIGLTSHLGIHGNTVTSLTLEDLHIKDFETHGLAVNEFNSLSMQNVEIGPSVNGQLGLNGIYSLARAALPIFRDAAQKYPDTTVSLGNKNDDDVAAEETSLQDLVDTLVDQMDLAFSYAYTGETPNEDDENYDTWLAAESLFINDVGIARSGVVYGALLRSRGASVFGYGKSNGGRSSDLVMKNVVVHDLSLSMHEVVSIGNSQHRWVKDMFNGPVPFVDATDNKLNELSESKYTGNAWTDLLVAIRIIDTSWWHLGRTTMWTQFVSWAKSGDLTLSEALGGTENEAIFKHCNNDYLGHVPKGVLGLRLENIDSVEMDNVEVYNIMTSSPLGSDECGQYKGGDDGGMPLQNEGTNAGYGGTNSRAIYMFDVKDCSINDLYVHHIMSSNGPSYGLYLYSSKDVLLTGDTKFEHIHGGLETLSQGLDYSTDVWPNTAARACAIETQVGSYVSKSSDRLSIECLTGHTFCSCDSDTDSETADDSETSTSDASCYGTISSACDSDASYQLPFYDVSITNGGKDITFKEIEDGGYQAKNYFESVDVVRKTRARKNKIKDNGRFGLIGAMGLSLVVILCVGLARWMNEKVSG